MYYIGMTFRKILVVIIQTPNSDRYIPLSDDFYEDSRFELVFSPATMLYSNDEILNKNISRYNSYFNFFVGRDLSPGEVGCADSHNAARFLISQNSFGGIILEDDARLIDKNTLVPQIIDFLSRHQDEEAVLSLTRFRNSSSKSPHQLGPTLQVFRLIGQPDLAVAYALTKKAADALVRANTPIKWVSDWPMSTCKFFTVFPEIFLHGDQDTKSIILDDTPDFRKSIKSSIKLKLLFVFPLFNHSYPKVSFKTYFNEVFLRRLTWRFDRVLMFLRNIRFREIV